MDDGDDVGVDEDEDGDDNGNAAADDGDGYMVVAVKENPYF